MTEKPVKCASKEFNVEAFYLIQANRSEKRYVAYFKEAAQIKMFLLGFIDKAQNEIRVKIRDMDDPEHSLDFEGSVDKQKLKNALETFKSLLFYDGYHDLMLRLPETGDYVAFDEHGLIYVYTKADYAPLLNSLGLRYRPKEKLVYQYDHLHYRPANAREDLKKLANELGLQAQ